MWWNVGSLGWHVDGSGCGGGLHDVDGGDGLGPVHRLTPWMVSMERLAGPWSMMSSAKNHHFERVLHVGDLGDDGDVDLCHLCASTGLPSGPLPSCSGGWLWPGGLMVDCGDDWP